MYYMMCAVKKEVNMLDYIAIVVYRPAVLIFVAETEVKINNIV